MRVVWGLLAGLVATVAAGSVRATPPALRLGPGEPLVASALEELLAAHLPVQGPGRRLVPTVTAPRLPLANPSARDVTVRVGGLELDATTQHLAARLLVEVEGGPANVLEITGRVQSLVEVPVPRRAIEPGARLGDDDVETAWLPAAQARAGTVIDIGDLAGREAVRRLAPGRPVRTADLRRPRLIRKGETVTLVYTASGLELSAQGRALGDAGEGETIRVLNTGSARQVEGVVLGPGRVAVGPGREGRS